MWIGLAYVAHFGAVMLLESRGDSFCGVIPFILIALVVSVLAVAGAVHPYAIVRIHARIARAMAQATCGGGD